MALMVNFNNNIKLFRSDDDPSNRWTTRRLKLKTISWRDLACVEIATAQTSYNRHASHSYGNS